MAFLEQSLDVYTRLSMVLVEFVQNPKYSIKAESHEKKSVRICSGFISEDCGRGGNLPIVVEMT